MKKKIIAVIAFVLVVTGVPFCAIKGDEAARARAKEAAESQNKEWYKEANACIDAGEYEDAIKLLEKLPTDYEDSRYIIPYAEYCKGVADKGKKIKRIKGQEKSINKKNVDFSSSPTSLLKKRKKERKKKKKEKEKREEIKKDVPYKGMERKNLWRLVEMVGLAML